MATEGMCWCASDMKCPHGISHKLPTVWEDLERVIDEVLQNFDRKSIRRFLKKSIDGQSKPSREHFKAPDDVKAMMEKAKMSEPFMNSPEMTGKKRRSDAMDNELMSKTMPLHPGDSELGNRSQPLKRPNTVGESRSASVSQLPKIPVSTPETGFKRDLMSNSLPKLPPRTSVSEPKSAWTNNSASSPTSKTPMKDGNNSSKAFSHDLEDEDEDGNMTNQSSLQKTNPLYPMQAESIIQAGLMRIVDQLARKLLPWQAVICPRAVETLQDLRLTLIQSKHALFMQQMKAKLEEKVMAFLRKKEEEVDTWLNREIAVWQEFLEKDEIDLTDFIKADLERLTNRAIAQDQAYRKRELQIANELDDHERDQTREQLVNFRMIVRASKNPLPGGNSIFDQEPKPVEVRVLQENIAKAQSSIKKKAVDSTRNTIRRIEESHDWLCSLADNAMTAAISEERLKVLYERLDLEKNKSMDSLTNALANYKEQHNSILEAITVFAGRIHQHASDYLQREQLVTRAFLSYLLAIISGEIKSHTGEQKKSSYAWEIKSLTDREFRKESVLLTEFHNHINPLDKMVNEFKEKLKVQLDHITMKLQSIVNGKENDINARKALIHKKLAKHVNKACNARRQRLKNATAIRRDEFELESLAMMKVKELTSDLRSSVDSIWVKEHLKERKIYEASIGRLERLEKSALIIWNKHSHLAIETHEDYQDWLDNYKKDRDLKITNHKYEIEKTYLSWRDDIGIDMKNLSSEIRFSFKALIPASIVYSIDDSLEKNLSDLTELYDQDYHRVMSGFAQLKENLEMFIKHELTSIDNFNVSKRQELLNEYQTQLVRLDSYINRRIGSLKDMEADLEETIRLTILQHEVENNVFEQLSCVRLEKFWIDWFNKVTSLTKELVHTQEDYEVSKRLGNKKSRINKKDRMIDDLVDVAKESAITSGNADNAAKLKQTADTLNQLAAEGKKTMFNNPDEEPKEDPYAMMGEISDTMRIKIILDDVKLELYRDFVHKTTRGLEKVRRELGEGRKQLVPTYAILKVIAMNCDRFYEKSRLNERCVGRISANGVLLYQEGLPVHAKHKFIMGTALSLLTILPIKDYRIDCEDVFLQLNNNIKVYFLIGLLNIINSYHEFGEYFIRSESLWICSVLEIPPPQELLIGTMAKGLKENIPDSFDPNGIYSDDPVEAYNKLMELPTDIETVENLTRVYRVKQQMYQKYQEQNQSVVPYNNDNHSLTDNDSLSNDPSRQNFYNREPANVFQDMESFKPMTETLNKLQAQLPFKDCVVMSALLGRPDGTIEYTTHRICQVISIWRRVSVAIIRTTLSPPSTEYPRIQELITLHNTSMSGRKRVETSNIHCISPFEAISSAIDYLTSIQGLPISFLQAAALLSKGGSCDPWLEDPKQSFRHERLIGELQDMVDLYAYRIPKSMIHDEFLQLSFPKKIAEMLGNLDLNFSNMLPLEALRTFLQRDDLGLTNTQISVIFWALCRQNDEMDDSNSVNPSTAVPPSTVGGEGSVVTEGEGNQSQTVQNSFQTGGGHRPIVATQFVGDPEKYMVRFGEDVDKYLHSMPSIDSNVILGYLTNILSPTSAHELVSDAMKLDSAARNPLPSSCCLWLSSKIVNRDDALKALILPGQYSNEGNYLIGVTTNPFTIAQKLSHHDLRMTFLIKLRSWVEVDLLSKFPEISEIRASDRHYGPQGNDPMTFNQTLSEDFHWKELLNRRVQRLDRLTKSWRDTMLSEWAESLYISRQMRYQQRINLIQKSVSVYHTQYHDLREAILHERSGLISLYAGLENEIITMIQDDYSLITYHTSFIDRLLRRFEGEYERIWLIIKEMMLYYLKHISSIRRYGIDRINAASARLKIDLDNACNGLIVGYTTGFAQGYFDELIVRGEIWRKKLTDLQGQLIVLKEHFMFQKDEIDRDLTIQITDRLTNNRMQTKSHLQSLTDDSTVMLELVSNTRTSYASLQKDANTRLILRIEKAIRESRKLRNAAEQQPEIEEAVLRDIRHVLDKSKAACIKIVDTIKETCLKQLHSLLPTRQKHQHKMEVKVEHIKELWKDVENILFPLIDDYEKEVNKQLSLMNSKGIDMINIYQENEIESIQNKFISERKLLIAAFRKHFREYDLNELVIFERFNDEVSNTVQEMIRLWGPSRPRFIMGPLKELQIIIKESLTNSYRDIKQSSMIRNELNDTIIMSRMELTDMYHFNLSKSYDYVKSMPQQFLIEKEATLQYIDEMSMEKNGDMVRPQVKAVMDLLISGIEIDHDFRMGYDNLINATKVKSNESFVELNDFKLRYLSIDYPVSIPTTIDLNKQKIQQRKDEVQALLDASQAHLIADHSKLDVLFAAGEKDIEEWTNLTLQLIENAYHNAELNYLSNLWPTPEATPRPIDDGENLEIDEDRVGKLKQLISQQQATGVYKPTTSSTTSNALVPAESGYDINLNNLNNSFQPNNLANYTGDVKLLLQSLALSPEEEEEEQRLIEQRKREKAMKKQQKEAAKYSQQQQQQPQEDEMSVVSDLASITSKNDFKTLKTVELQQGWFECHSPEGYLYYYNPETKESLWDLPQFLKKPKHVELEESVELDELGNIKPKDNTETIEKLLDTPRELLLLEGNIYPEDTMPIRIVPEQFRLDMKVDRKVIMSEVAEEARAVTALVLDTALDITKIIHGRKGRDEQTIAVLLGDRYNPNILKKYQQERLGTESMKSVALDQFIQSKLGEEDYEKAQYENYLKQEALLLNSLTLEKQLHIDEAKEKLLNEKGFVIDHDDNDPQQQEGLDEMKTNAEVDELLKNLGLGSNLEQSIIDGVEEQMAKEKLSPSAKEIVNPNEWLSLGLGDKPTRGDHETESSDGEEYTGFKHKVNRIQTIEELKYFQAKEIELMSKEDLLSIAIENMIENENCQLFLSHLLSCKEKEEATIDDKEYLQELSKKIRYVNILEIFRECDMPNTFDDIDELIKVTIIKREQELKLQEEMKTKEGLLRQQYILEHNDDIQEMMKFFLEKANLSKILSKKLATELILRNIATPKKLAKIWLIRKEIDIEKEFPELDYDDLEELEKALMSLINNASDVNLLSTNPSFAVPPGMNPSMFQSSNGGYPMGGYMASPMMMTGPMMTATPSMPYMDSSQSFHLYQQQQQQQQHASFHQHQYQQQPAYSSSSPQLISPFASAPTMAMDTSKSAVDLLPSITELPPQEEMIPIQNEQEPSRPRKQSANLDDYLAMEGVTHVIEEEIPDDKSITKQQQNAADILSQANSTEQQRQQQKGSSALQPKYTMTKDGYKSFRGGWIEGVSDNNEIYYYNVKTGQSSWNLPDLVHDESAEDHLEVAFEGTAQDHNVNISPRPTTAGVEEIYRDNTNNNTNEQALQQVPAESSYPEDPNNYYTQYNNYENYDPNYYNPNGSQSGGANNGEYYPPYDPNSAAVVNTNNYYDPNYYDQNLYQNYPTYSDPNQQQQQQYYDPNQQYYDPNAYYDPNNPYQVVPHADSHSVNGNNEVIPYQTDGNWRLSDALGNENGEEVHLYDYVPPQKPRAFPTYQTLEVSAYAKKEGTQRQLVLLQTQDRWQNALVKTQHTITELKTKFLQKRQEMYDKVTKRVDNRLNAFVEDIKFMQKTLKKELGDANATERDLRRLFEDTVKNKNTLVDNNISQLQPSLQSQDILRAEKLSFILESLEKFKVSVSEKYESAFKQIDKFAADWELIKMELTQIGDIFDEGVSSNLEQCKLACDHQSKLFVYEQIKQTSAIEKTELKLFRKGLSMELKHDSFDAINVRELKRQEQLDYYFHREMKKEEIRRVYQDRNPRFLDSELNSIGLPNIAPEDDMLTEEELVMSFLLTQIEMENSLVNDYHSILDASKTMAIELQASIKEFDATEKKNIREDGSWFNKHRETLERHEQALHITLNKVRNRVNEGYQILQNKIESLDHDVERAAEEELYQGSVDHMSTKSSI